MKPRSDAANLPMFGNTIGRSELTVNERAGNAAAGAGFATCVSRTRTGAEA